MYLQYTACIYNILPVFTQQAKFDNDVLAFAQQIWTDTVNNCPNTTST